MFEAVIKDFAWVGLLLLIGAYLRSKVTIFQKLYIPTAVIAGIVGLLLGPQVLGAFCPVYIHWSEYMNQYATPLLAMLFCVQFFGLKFDRNVMRQASAVWVIATIVISSQYLFAVPFVKAFGLPDGFAALPQSAFYGGHGIPGVLAGIWTSMNYWNPDEAFSVGTTFATIGLLYGVIGGIIIINIAVRKGWLATGKSVGTLTEEEMTGYIKPENRQKFMVGITKGASIDPMAFHVALMFALMIASYGLLAVMKWLAAHVSFLSSLSNLNVMVPALIVSLVVGSIASKTKLGDVCDKDSLARCGCTALEFLIASSVAATNLGVVVTYGAPILIISAVLLAVTTVFCLVLSKLWIRTNWFEHAITTLGCWTGVVATGLMLLRIADPDMKTDASVNVMTASPIWTLTSQNLYLAIVPMMLVTPAGFTRSCWISGALIVGLLVFGFIFYRKKA